MEAALIGPLGRTVLGTTKITIGRAPDNTLVLNDMKASSHHAEIRPEGQYYSLVDLGSMNGTFVNEQQVYGGTPRPLRSGDTIRIGDTKLTYEISSTSQSASYSDDSTLRAAPPPPAMPNFAGNTSYGMGNYSGQLGYPPTESAQPQFSPPAYPDPQSPYAMPAQQPSYVSETQLPTYVSPSYGQTGQPPSYTQPPQTQPPIYMQQPQTQPPGYMPPPSYTQPPQTQPPKPSPIRRIVLAVIALVIILAAVGSFLLISHNNQVAQQNTNATATAQTSHNHATATALAQQNATATAFAQATAIATSHYPPFTTVALNDSLTSASSTWPSSTICQFSSGAYQVSIQQANIIQYCLNTGGQYGEMAYQVTMSIQQGDCGGLIFRRVDNNNFYFFEVCQNGKYNLGDYVNNNESTLGFQTSSAIKQGSNQQNVIAVTVQGDTVNMYVNGKNIDTATSSPLTSTTFSQGQIGLLASDVTNPTSVAYTNALVWTAS